jgi:hypothetical protein
MSGLEEINHTVLVIINTVNLGPAAGGGPKALSLSSRVSATGNKNVGWVGRLPLSYERLVPLEAFHFLARE